MNFQEKELENWIVESAKTKEGREKLNGCNFYIHENDKLLQQVNLQGYGILDLLKISYEPSLIHFEIIELKVVKSSYKEIGQLSRYMMGLRRYLNKLIDIDYISFDISGVLIAPNVEMNDDFIYLMSSIWNIDCFSSDYTISYMTYNYDFNNGIQFKDGEYNYYNTTEKDELLHLDKEVIQKVIKKCKIITNNSVITENKVKYTGEKNDKI